VYAARGYEIAPEPDTEDRIGIRPVAAATDRSHGTYVEAARNVLSLSAEWSAGAGCPLATRNDKTHRSHGDMRGKRFDVGDSLVLLSSLPVPRRPKSHSLLPPSVRYDQSREALMQETLFRCEVAMPERLS
jgi:hypothetical protein